MAVVVLVVLWPKIAQRMEGLAAAIEGLQSREAEVGGAEANVDRKATMHARPRHLCAVVYCTADDLLPEKPCKHPGK